MKSRNVQGIFVLLVLAISLSVLTLPTEGKKPVVTYYIPGSDDNETNQEETCLVPCDEIVSGGPPPDGIPSIDNPKFYSVPVADDVLDDRDVVLGIEIEGQVYGYPIEILNWHEIVNQRIQGAILSITYCPLTGTGIPYSYKAELGTSGKLYENNLVFYDRDSESYWSQMYGLAIKGEKMGEQLEFSPIVETVWSAFKLMYPDAQVLTRDTGYTRDYDSYPYSRYNYLRSEAILFPTSYDKEKEPYNLYHPKELTSVIKINGSYALFPFEELDTDIPVSVIHEGVSVGMFFDRYSRLAIPYDITLNGEILYLQKTDGSKYDISEYFGLTVYDDQFDNVWNMKGVAIDGPNKGARLQRILSYNAFWFAATAFFSDSPIYTKGQFTNYEIRNRIGTYSDESILFFPWQSLFLMLIPLLILRRRRK